MLILAWLVLTVASGTTMTYFGSWLFGTEKTIDRVFSTFLVMAFLFGCGTAKNYIENHRKDNL